MFKKIKLIIVPAAFLIHAACSSNGYDWMSGTYSGTSRLTSKSDYYSSSVTELEKGKGGFTFDAVSFFTLSDETLLPGCHLQVSTQDENGKFWLPELDRAYKGYSQDMQGCLAEINGASTRVDITNGWIKREENGDTILYLMFRVRDMPDEPLFEYELKTRKSSWF